MSIIHPASATTAALSPSSCPDSAELFAVTPTIPTTTPVGPWGYDIHLAPGSTPTINELLLRAIWGEGYDPATGRVDMRRFADWLQNATDRFGAELVTQLCRAGADTAKTILLDVNFTGGVAVASAHPHKAAIESLFWDDETLAITYRKLTSAHHLLASSRLGQRYTTAWNDCRDNAERDAVWRHYISMFEKLGKLSGQMALKRGTMVSSAHTFSTSFPLG
ncbi:MAG TPA: hypothetical protein VEB64_00875 [Azospirillaceae bacterium]|nr:hypothetical protein [Azospirillaceae bacterium]